MTHMTRRYCRRRKQMLKISCWLCIIIIFMTQISSFIGKLNHQEVDDLSDPISERWQKEKLHIVIRPEIETAIIQPKLKYNSICHDLTMPRTLLPDGTIKILILVTSSPPNAEARKAIRNTWGDSLLLPQWVEVYFVLGTTHDEQVMKSVKKEADEFNDIIMEDFIDSYGNLTYKTIFALKWATRNCSEATHLFKTDDDMLIIPEILTRKLYEVRDSLSHLQKMNVRQRNFIPSIRKNQYLQEKITSTGKEKKNQDSVFKNRETANKLDRKDEYLCLTNKDDKRDEDETGEISNGYILGKILRSVRPYRNKNSKWYLPYTLYYKEELPDFASGTAYIIANGNKHCGVIKSLFLNSLKMKPVLPLEDVFITGIVAEHLGLQLIEDNKKFSSSIPVIFPWSLSRLSVCYYKDMVAIHGCKPNDMITGWEYLLQVTEDDCNTILGQVHRNIYAMLAIFEMPNG